MTREGWGIRYYWPGPNRRYAGEFFLLEGPRVEAYLAAFQENWLVLESLKRSVPPGGEYTTAGKMGMTIRVGGPAEGVCLRGYHIPINSRDRLEIVVQGYRYAIQRAEQVRLVLSAL